MKQQSQQPIRKASLLIKDTVYETVYDPLKGETRFARLGTGGSVEFSATVEDEGKTYLPLDPSSDLITKNVVLLPSEPFEYGDDAALLRDIQFYIHKYVDISPTFENIATYYVMFTWIFDRFNEVPYLRAIGDFGSGKTRMLRVVGSVCYRPIFTGGATTTSPIFRILDQMGGTLVLDEADFKATDMKTDIIKILNEGYSKGSAVLRSEGKGEFEVKAYEVYSPKIIATRETFKDKALESRFLVEEMGHSELRKEIPLRLGEDFQDDSIILRNKLLMWRLRNYNKPLVMDGKHMEGIHPRLHQIVMPILALIQSEEIKQQVRDFMRAYHETLVEDRGWSWESDIIHAIFKLKNERGASKLLVKDITAAVNDANDISDDKLTSKKVGWYLSARLQLKSYRTRVGYELDLRANENKLQYAKTRFSVKDLDEPDDELMSLVNIVNDVEDDDDKSIRF